MIKRIFFVLFFIPWLPLLWLSIFTIPFTGLWAIGRFILHDDKDGNLVNIIFSPIEYILLLPWKVFNHD